MITDARSHQPRPAPTRSARVAPQVLLAVSIGALVPGAAASAQQQALPDGFHVGESFPVAAFPALEDGRPTSLADFRGERLILHVFASW